MFKIVVEGSEEKQSALRAFATSLPDFIDGGLREGGEPIVMDLMSYPSYEAGSSYTRTFTYQQAITPFDATIVSPGVFEASGHTPYDIFLRGDVTGGYLGAWMHIGRWQPLVSIQQSRIQGVRDAIQRWIDELKDRLGL